MAASRPTSLAALLSASATLSARTAHIGLVEWQRAVGQRLAQKTQPERLLEGTLTVRVPSSTWAQELSMLSETVLERLKAAGHNVQRLRFNVSAGFARPDLPVMTVQRAALPAGLRESISRVEDPELRQAISEAAAYSLGRGSR
jgi:predicted nucleic acid-binding Zn ribbon protein